MLWFILELIGILVLLSVAGHVLAVVDSQKMGQLPCVLWTMGCILLGFFPSIAAMHGEFIQFLFDPNNAMGIILTASSLYCFYKAFKSYLPLG